MGREVTQSISNYLAQNRKAAEQSRKIHEKLIAAGAEWDGMDGYSLTAAQAKEALGE